MDENIFLEVCGSVDINVGEVGGCFVEDVAGGIYFEDIVVFGGFDGEEVIVDGHVVFLVNFEVSFVAVEGFDGDFIEKGFCDLVWDGVYDEEVLDREEFLD